MCRGQERQCCSHRRRSRRSAAILLAVVIAAGGLAAATLARVGHSFRQLLAVRFGGMPTRIETGCSCGRPGPKAAIATDAAAGLR
jgi:hypothetical protein